MVLSGDCNTVRQPRVEEVSSGEGGAHFVEFYQRAARLLYHRVLERVGGLVDKIHISCCATAHRNASIRCSSRLLTNPDKAQLAYIVLATATDLKTA